MIENKDLNHKRIRDSAPYRKSIAMSELDLKRATELERLYPSIYPNEAPFNFSKTISKAIEVSYLQILAITAGQIQGEVKEQISGKTEGQNSGYLRSADQPFGQPHLKSVQKGTLNRKFSKTKKG